MCTNPLSDYFAMGGANPGFESNCTALWRGYVGSWEIVDERLYLIGISGTLEGGVEASMTTMFPDFPDRVFAHWYSGTIRKSRRCWISPFSMARSLAASVSPRKSKA